jgi:butyryl-CoA dehydrogenase
LTPQIRFVLEQFAQISSAVAFPVFESSVGPVRAIEKFAAEKLAQQVIPPVCRGEKVVAVAMSEPDAGSALTDLKTRAEVVGGSVIVNGTKRWCSGGGHSDGYVVYCRMSDDPGARGIGAVYVEKGTPGLYFGPQEHMMGFRGVPSSDVFLDNVGIHGLLDNRRALTPDGKYVLIGGGGPDDGRWIGPMINPIKAMLLGPFILQLMRAA